jgi:predicted transcriptional regulator
MKGDVLSDQMAQINHPNVAVGGLVTVAYLKARLDEGEDHLGIYMPLLYDVLNYVPNRHFTVAEVQEVLVARHGVAMPQETVMSLLKRAARKEVVTRDAGRFHINPAATLPRTNVAADKAQVQAAQLRLAQALQRHGDTRGLQLATPQDALDVILRFLEDQQIALILGVIPADQVASLSQVESAVVAEFLHDIVGNDSALSVVLKGILEGLVLYHAAFLPDLPDVSRNFSDLTVVFDSVLVRRALGYEGTSPQLLLRDTIDLLARCGIRCVVFDKTVQEIQRILRMYQDKLATSPGRRSLHQVPMTRHFLTQRYSPSDVQEMSALLEGEIASAGLRIVRAPRHVAELTHDEAKLASRLADPKTHDVTEPRVQHDVDCVAGVLTLRRGHRSYRVEDAKVVFATTASLVIQNTRLWWEEDENETGVPPIVHIRALANLAWLKRPSTTPDLLLRDLVALCAAAMRPTQRTWQRFLVHLDGLQASQRLSQEQVTAIIVSAVSDRLLHDAETDEDDPDDVDAGTLDEVVDRVVADYESHAAERVAQAQAAADARVTEAETAARTEAAEQIAQAQAAADARVSTAETTATNASETLRRRNLVIEGRARRWAGGIAALFYWVLVILVVVASLTAILHYSFEQGWIGVLAGLAVLVFLVLEGVGVLGHIRSMRLSAEIRLYHALRQLLSGDPSAPSESGSER